MFKKFIQKRTRFGVMLLGALLLSGSYTFSQTCNANHLIDEAKAIVDNEAEYTVPSITELKQRLVAAINVPGDCTLADGLQQAIDNVQAKEIPYNVVINIYQNPTNQMAFNWFTNENITGGELQMVQGEATENDFASPLIMVPATCRQITLEYNDPDNDRYNPAGIAYDNLKSYTENKARATGLIPNTLYSFRVGKAGAWSDIGTFSTAPNNTNDFSFIYTTDTHLPYGGIDISQHVSHTAFEKYPNAGFWLHCGDMVDSYGESEWEWEQFFETQQNFFYKIPFVPVLGNHDSSPSRNFRKHFNTESQTFESGWWDPDVSGSDYSFVYGDALFLALNSEEYNDDSWYEKNGDGLIPWMRGEVDKYPDVKWRIVYFHKAIYTGGDHHSSNDGKIWREKMAPVFDELHINLALQGHDHIYEVIGPVYDNQLVEGAVSHQKTVTMNNPENVTGKSGGIYNTQEGTLYFLNNSNGIKKFNPLSEEEMVGWEYKTNVPGYFGLFTGRFGQSGRPTFSNVRVTADTIFITTHEVFDDGHTELFDEIKVVKSIPVTGVTVSPATVSLAVGETAALTATVEPNDATTQTVTWSSSDAAIAAVDATTGEVTAVSAGETIITATTQDGGKTSVCVVTVTVPVTGVTVSPATLSLPVGESTTLTPTVEPNNATNQTVTWSSSDAGIAIVDATTGEVTAVAVGEAIITATTQDGGKTSACTVTVIVPVTGISLDNSALTLAVGESEQLVHTIEPANATNQNVTWASSNDAIVTVSDGTVTAIAAGTAIITVITDYGKFTDNCEVTVMQPVTGVSLDKSVLTLAVGKSEQLIHTIEPANATNQNVTWSSDDENIATVENGLVTAVSAGETTITVTADDGGFTATCAVTVTAATVPVTGVNLSLTTLSLTKGDTKTLIATVIPDHATNQNITWKSSNNAVAIVNDGTVTAIAAGTVSITATTEDGGFTASCSITVIQLTSAETIDKPLAKLYPNPTDGRFTLHFEAPGTYSITIATMSGAILLRQTVNDQMIQMDISSYPAGIYLMMVNDGKRQSITKIVKTK